MFDLRPSRPFAGSLGSALALCLTLSGCSTKSAVPTDKTDPAAAISKFGGQFERDPSQAGNPIVSIDLSNILSLTDLDITWLKSLDRLKKLNLSMTGITDDGLRDIGKLEQLEELLVAGTMTTDHTLRRMKNLKNVKVLQLSFTRITDLGLEDLKGFNKLETLALIGTSTSGRALLALAECENLQSINMDSTFLSDTGLPHAAKLKALTTLDVSNTRVSEQAIAALAKLNPKIKIKSNETKK